MGSSFHNCPGKERKFVTILLSWMMIDEPQDSSSSRFVATVCTANWAYIQPHSLWPTSCFLLITFRCYPSNPANQHQQQNHGTHRHSHNNHRYWLHVPASLDLIIWSRHGLSIAFFADKKLTKFSEKLEFFTGPNFRFSVQQLSNSTIQRKCHASGCF